MAYRPISSQIFQREAFPHERLTRRPPRLFGETSNLSHHEDVIDHTMAADILPASFVRRVRNVFVRSNIIFYSDGVDLRPSPEQWRAQEEASYPPDFISQTNLMSSECRSPGFFVGSAGSSNYGHWLVDDLGRALHYISRYCPSTVYLSSTSRRLDIVKQDSICFLDKSEYFLDWLDYDKLYNFPELSFCDPISIHPVMKSRSALDAIRRTHNNIERGAGKHRIFCNRLGARSILNLKDVEDVLIAFDFLVVETSRLSFREQASLFRNASAIVGVMGAAMCNTLFCEPNTQVIYLCPSLWTEPFYWDLAECLGHLYSVILCEFSGSDHNSCIVVDCNALRSVLESCLNQSHEPE